MALPSEVVGQLCDLGIQSCADLAMLWDSGRQCVQELEERMRTTFSEGLAAQVRAAWTTAWRESKSRREDHVRSVVQERCSSVLNPGTGSRVAAREVILKPPPVSNRIRTIQPTGGAAGFSVLSGPSGPDPFSKEELARQAKLETMFELAPQVCPGPQGAWCHGRAAGRPPSMAWPS